MFCLGGWFLYTTMYKTIHVSKIDGIVKQMGGKPERNSAKPQHGKTLKMREQNHKSRVIVPVYCVFGFPLDPSHNTPCQDKTRRDGGRPTTGARGPIPQRSHLSLSKMILLRFLSCDVLSTPLWNRRPRGRSSAIFGFFRRLPPVLLFFCFHKQRVTPHSDCDRQKK